MLNNCIFEGRVTKDPELKRTPSGLSIANFTIAVDRSVKKEGKGALFLPVTFFGSQAENISKYFRKGRAIIVTGRLENDEYTDKMTGDKKTVYFLSGTAFDFPLTEKNTEKPAAPAQEPLGEIKDETPAFGGAGLDNIDITDDDMPF